MNMSTLNFFITAIFQISDIFGQTNALAKYLANAKFGYCDFFPEPKVTSTISSVL